MITKEKITGMIGASIFIMLLFVILLFSYFTMASPPQDLEGIPVMFGNMEDAGGYEEPPMNEITPPVEKIIVPQNIPTEAPLIAQTVDNTIAIKEQQKNLKEEEERKKRVQQEELRRRQEEAAERKKREQEEARKRAISNEMSGLFGENAGSRGTTEGQGTQGVSTGNSNQGATTGTGGIGSFNLGGRSLGSGGLIQPKYAVDDYGTVVVNITVDSKGNVIEAEIGKGTNTGNTSLRTEALRAARSTKFNSISTANNQQGTITYKFNLN